MKTDKKATYAIITIICVVLFLIWFVKQKESDSFVMVSADATQTPAITEAIAQTENDTQNNIDIKVYIAGEVTDPGVYEVDSGSRIEDVIELAGGATDEANLLGVNLSKKVYDEQQIIIPKIGEEVDKSLLDPPNDNTDVNEKVNINTADKERLKTLPGIGDTIADAIIDYRENNGNFKNIEDVKNVYRIGDKTFERFKDNIIVE